MTRDTNRPVAPLFLFAGGPGARADTYASALQEAFIAAAKGGRPRVAYIGAASRDDRRFLGMMASFLGAAGPCEFELAPLAGKKRDLQKARAVIEAADLVFIGGGDVEVGMHVLAETHAVEWLREKHASGAPFLGLSAGAIMLGRRWVRWRDPEDETTVELFPCLGFAPLECDVHEEEDGWAELKTLLRLLGEEAVGFGIRTDAAMRVDEEVEVTVLAGVIDRGTWRTLGAKNSRGSRASR